ncbi:helix-turn-helix transcriptional regulator [Exilibacterium tricleocarpae]|uniref:Helix-turn-helix transcriptional regulator n=1 Tax=Exilibacterium tricleocarpae TaxID=2591008 RepID=A0A545U8A0_9GAMM|nr:helix-turn-helix transcriptional regulator [Exilibacterium tricleocarpae]TQV85691.1 helix-turn-helix transcriptional regulator [Exilibacterium tricleocarpae]
MYGLPFKAWRLFGNKSQRDVADQINISQSAYQQLENSEAKKQKRGLEKLASAFDCQLEQLTVMKENKYSGKRETASTLC